MVALDRSFMLEQDAERFERRGVRSKWEKDALFEIRAKVRRARVDLAAARARLERKEAA